VLDGKHAATKEPQTGDLEDHLAVPVVSVVGRSNVGKTTFVEQLIRELKRRGYHVGTIKHYRHEFEIDQPGKDSWRHFQAGSDVAVISSPHKMALVRRLNAELALDDIVAAMSPVDIILTEGYKHEGKPKIEVFRQAAVSELVCAPDELIAIVTDLRFDMPVPQFGLDEASGVADLLESMFLVAEKRPPSRQAPSVASDAVRPAGGDLWSLPRGKGDSLTGEMLREDERSSGASS
jgi:molybdopterin-guanine dinucleotide biosynthesis protein B